MNKRRILVLTLALMLSVGMFAGSNGALAASDSKTELRVGINADCSDLGPFSSGSNGRNSMILTMYQTLGELQGVGGKLEGVIMKSYETLENNTYNIEIYDYIYDTAGNHITAGDVAFCYNKGKEMGSNSTMKYITGVEATGEYTLKLVSGANFVGGFENIAKAIPIVSKAAYEASPDEMATTPIGTTQYKLTEFVPGASATFEKAETFWQKPDLTSLYSQANVDKITYTTIKEAAQMSIALETGAIDIGLSMDAIEAKRFMEGGERASGFKVFDQVTNIGNQMYLSGDANSPFYNNQALRQAVCYAIDRQGLINAVLGGYGIMEYTFGGEMFSDFNPEWKNQDYYTYNLDKAKELLAQSGFDASQKTLRIMTDNTSLRNRTAQIVQAFLLQLGIKSEILQYDSALFNSYKNKPGEWEICLDNTGSSDYLVTVWRGKFDARQYSTGTINGWQDEQLQKLMEAALSTEGHTPADMDAFHQYFKEQAYGLGLFNHTFFSVTVDKVDNIMYDAKMFVYIPGTTLK